LDLRLRPFLEAETDDAAAAALDALLAALAAVIVDAVRRELTGSFKGADHIEDVAADVRLRLVRMLSRLRAPGPGGEATEIDNIAGYASVTAERAAYAFLRRQFPERTRFRNRVRYVVTHHPHANFVAGADRVWRASSRIAVRRAPRPGATVSFIEDPAHWLHAARIDVTQPLPSLIDAVLQGLDAPIEFDRLVDALAAALGVVDHGVSAPPERMDGTDARREAVDPAPPVLDVMAQRESLLGVWREIVELPTRQRAALLLNLRDPDGGAVLQMLPATGVVTAEAIAVALDISPAALSRLWARLPLDDLSIAEQLGLTRQQIINLRKSARARLARRLGENRP
jgi:hypothetical protein